MTRTYEDWEHDARNTTKSVTKLGNELRDRWDDWKPDAPYRTFDECIMAELGITADALRVRNTRGRAKSSSTVTDVTVNEPPQPRRQVPGTASEIDRRRTIAASLWQEGWPRPNIASALGVNEGTAQRDLIATGCEGRRPKPTTKDRKPEGDFRWRNADLGIPDEESTIEKPSFAACDTPSAAQAIADIRVQLSLILGGRYRLSLKDRNNLISILDNALERLHNDEDQNAQNPSHSARVAG